MPIALILAGYDEERVGKPELSVYNAYVPGSVKLVREHNSQNSYGANWTGQTDVITRVVLGRDPRLDQLESLQAAKAALGDQKVLNDLMGLEYIINWGTMTLLDAVDFAKLMIETTSAIQRFSDGIQMMPGDMPGVGGPIDVGVIFPVEGFKWSERKKLTLENTETLK